MPVLSTVGAAAARAFGLTAQAGRAELSFTYATNTQGASLNLSTLSGYRTGKSDITITINSGVYVYGAGGSGGSPGTSGGIGLDISGGAVGDTCNIINLGFILGGGGGGSDNGQAGANGGAALNWNAAINVTIDNTNGSAYIAGGGGSGGGRSGTGGGGGAGGAEGGTTGQTPGAGGGPGASGTNGTISFSVKSEPATATGGGSGRILPGTGGAGRTGFSAGQGGGAGGGGGSRNEANGGGGGSGQSAGGSNVGSGGGGGWGASGGSATGASAAGGSGGKAVNLNGKTVTWVSGNTTRVYGAVS